jgi:hypothetical protein
MASCLRSSFSSLLKQSTHPQVSGEQYSKVFRHWQYFLRHWEFLHLQNIVFVDRSRLDTTGKIRSFLVYFSTFLSSTTLAFDFFSTSG